MACNLMQTRVMDICFQVCADASLAAALTRLPLLVTVMAQAPANKGSAAAEPRPLGTAEIDLSPLLHARWAFCVHTLDPGR